MTVPTVDVELGQAFAASDDALRDSPLSATLAMRTILSRLVMFQCDICNERLPMFHPCALSA